MFRLFYQNYLAIEIQSEASIFYHFAEVCPRCCCEHKNINFLTGLQKPKDKKSPPDQWEVLFCLQKLLTLFPRSIWNQGDIKKLARIGC